MNPEPCLFYNIIDIYRSYLVLPCLYHHLLLFPVRIPIVIFTSLNPPLPLNAMSTQSYDHANKLENNDNGSTIQLERLTTAGGHLDDRSQPSLPVVHRSFANPAPLGLLSFATGSYTEQNPRHCPSFTQQVCVDHGR